MKYPRHQTGHVSELYVASIYAKLGYLILWPMSGFSRYDFVVEKEGTFKRVQVKKASWVLNNGKKYLQARTSPRNKNENSEYKKGDFDEYAFTDGERVWIIPFDHLEYLTSITLDSDNEEYKEYQKKYDPKNYLVEMIGERQ